MLKSVSFLAMVAAIVLAGGNAAAQKYNQHWFFGERAAMDFSTTPPTRLNNSAMTTNEGCATVSHPVTGELLFYTNGDSIWNRNHQPMPNGFGLGGHYSTTQAAVAVPDPGNANRYYVFTVYAQADEYPVLCCGSGGLNLNLVDMTLAGGLGDVIVKNELVVAPTSEKLAVVKHCNGIDYWVIVHEWNSDSFRAYPLTASGLGTPVISAVGTVHQDVGSGLAWETIGYMRVSPNGKKLALAISQAINRVELFDFNDQTGVVSNMLFSDSVYPNQCGFTGPYGVSFSPDNTKLYVSVNVGGCASSNTEPGGVFQYDLNAGSGAAVLGSRTSIVSTTSSTFGALQIGPDGKLYVAKFGNGKLDVIQNPNAAGAACNYTADAFTLTTPGVGQTSRLGLPNMVESFLNPTESFTVAFNGCFQADTVVFLDTMVTSPFTVQWNFGDPATGAANSSTLQHPFHDFSSHGIFNVTLTIFMPCDTITITRPLNAAGTLELNAGPDTTLCTGQSYAFPPLPGTNYLWAPSTGLSCADCPDPVATPQQSTTYVVTANTADPACIASDTVIITVIDVFAMVVTPDTAICLGQQLQLSATGATSYSWSPSTGLSAADIGNPVAFITENITYTVIGAFGECGFDTQTVVITVNPLPTVDAGEGGMIFKGQSLQLSASSSASSVSWAPAASVVDPAALQTIVAPDTSTLYTITATDANGCTASDTVRVIVVPEEAFIFVPNAFSPNGDGVNDLLAYYLRSVRSINFKVYNRWGQLLFESDAIGVYWNGMYKRLPQPVGVYVYVAVAETESGSILTAQGNVTLLR